MTHHTDAERAEFEEFASVNGERPELVARNQAGEYLRLDTATGWMWWQAARRAPAEPVPQEPTSKQVVLGAGALLGQPENTADNRHPDWHSAVAKARSVYLAMLAAAPQPPDGLKRENPATKREAAPVQLPEPAFYADDRGYEVSAEWLSSDDATSDYREVYTIPRYTEQQVRELLAANGIGKDKE